MADPTANSTLFRQPSRPAALFRLASGSATVMADAPGSAVTNAVSAPVPSARAPGVIGSSPCSPRAPTSRSSAERAWTAAATANEPPGTEPLREIWPPPWLEQEDDQRCVHRSSHRARHPRRSQWPDQRQRRQTVARHRSGREFGAHRVRRGRRTHRRSAPGSGPVALPRIGRFPSPCEARS